MNPSNLTIQVIDRESVQDPIRLSIQTSSPMYASPLSKSPVKKSPHERKTLRARRPFKYIKHQGPRPIPTTSNNRIFHSNQIISINDSYVQSPPSKPKPNPRIRTSSYSDLRASRRSSTSNHNEPKSVSSRINENKPYSQSSSRLLKSRNLNLRAIDTTACQLSKKPGVEVLHDDSDSRTNSGLAAHQTSSPNRLSLSQHLSTSCFSAWSATTSSTQLKSYSFLSSNSNHSENHLTENLEKFNLFHPLPNSIKNEPVVKLPSLQKRSISYHESNPSHWLSDPHLINTSNSILPWN